MKRKSFLGKKLRVISAIIALVLTPISSIAQSVTDSAQVDEVVVTALGIKKEKKKLGYAVQEIQGADLVKAKEPNVINSLVGRVAGLTIGQSAELLGVPNIVLRGSDPNRGQSVLFVVDGIPINSDAYNLAPDDIDKVTVLKGPAAAALYGYRGQNGAIVITTKKGSKNGGISVEFNSNNMIENGFLTIPKVQDAYGPGDHGIYSFVDGKGAGLNDGDYDVWGPKFKGQMIQQYDGLKPWTARGANNLQNFLRPGAMTSNNFSVSTSTEKTDVRFSFTNLHQTGIVPNTQFNSNTFNISNTVRFNDRLRLDANINYNYQSTPNINDVNYGPQSLIYNMIIWGGADWDVNSADMKGIWQPGKEGVQQVYEEYQRYHNPWFVAEKWLRSHNKKDVYGYVSMNYELGKNLTAMVRSSMTSYNVLRTEKMPFSAHPYGREEGRGDYREDQRSMFEANNEVMVNYDKKIGNINVHVTAGGNRRDFNYSSSFISTDYLNVPEVYNFNNSSNPVKAYNFSSQMAVNSSYALADIGGKGFNLNLGVRRDQLSTLPINNNSYNYPSAALSVIPTDFMKKSNVLNFLKFRGSYAQVKGGLTNPTIGPAGYPIGYGAQYVTPYDGPSYTNSSVYSTPLVYQGKPSAYFTNTISNSGLQPFQRKNIEAGLEAKMFKNRFGIEATYFVYNDGPGIYQKTISDATGYTNQLVNGIKTQRKGWEVTLNGDIIRPKSKNGFKWEAMANFSRYREFLKEIVPGVDQISTNYFVGDNSSNRFLKVGDRIDALYMGSFARTSDGQLINDAGGRPIVLPKGQQQGFSLPDLVWGLFNKMSYKNFSIAFQLDGRVGGSIVNQIQRQTFRGGRNIETGLNNLKDGNGLGMADARDQDCQGVKSWVGEGVKIVSGTPKYDPITGQITNMGELTFIKNDKATYLQDYISRYYGQYEGSLLSKSYAKLREISITYKLPSKLMGKLFNSATVSIVGRNLLYFAKGHDDVDLDQFPGMIGYTSLQTPTLRRYGININLTF